jgi:hypothetical protein
VGSTSAKYKADITAGALKAPESRIIADLLLRGVDAQGWREAIVEQNVLQARNAATATRLARLIRGRLQLMKADLWRLVRDGTGVVATHAVFAAATSTPHRRKLEKERDSLIKQQTELQSFDEKLRHYADQRISLDLDDGMKVNYGKFGDLLAEVKAVTGGSEE